MKTRIQRFRLGRNELEIIQIGRICIWILVNDVKSENPISQNSQQRKSFYCYCVIFNHISLCGIAFTEKKCSVSTVAEFSNFLLDRRTDNFSNLHLEWVKITDFHWFFFSSFFNRYCAAESRGENNVAWLKSLRLEYTVDGQWWMRF